MTPLGHESRSAAWAAWAAVLLVLLGVAFSMWGEFRGVKDSQTYQQQQISDLDKKVDALSDDVAEIKGALRVRSVFQKGEQ